METTTIGAFGQAVQVNSPVRIKLLPADKMTMLLPSVHDEWKLYAHDLQIAWDTVCTELKFKPKQCVYSEVHSMSADGDLYNNTIELRIAEPSSLVISWLMTATMIRWVAVLMLQTQACVVIGTPELPLRLTWGKTTSGPADIKLTLGATLLTPSLFLDAGAWNRLGEAVFDLSFDLSFEA
jgi:hypothetical protein